MTLQAKRKGPLNRAHPALKKKHRVRPKMTRVAVESWAWTPLMEERRQGGGMAPGMDGRREVDRAKEVHDDDDTGGPDA